MKFGLKAAQINALQSVFAQYSAIGQVILYGSRAKGNYKPGSDIDLTIVDNGMTNDALSKLENSIDDLLLPYKIDLSLKKNIDNPDLIDHIDRVGQVFYDRNMLKAQKPSDPEQVTALIQNLDPVVGNIVETIRQIILGTDPAIGERIKWNNPSFYYTGEMPPFDPKEYKREIAVFNLFKGRVMLVFPSGAKVSDPSGLLEGDYADGRRITVFKDLEDVKAKTEALQTVLKAWLLLVDQ